ncbi:hypothetical protein [Alteriqipengyuania lutimaris]|uniref:Uncharacterized protein n=1 Tax=Alteriqipengyuania lutimaris TaxID=1538146 RepID=A0A395LJ13_9SPHN|nr:hypothetical protein [Alteriqipengyuania lutimaris]MBB3034064.1 hypothetical protein [Alteriqipengyuania lutimaris]RDS76996.1 hypothetical protein DL238_04820 [Alteriqipengyuania lutimaris]
MPDPVTRPLTAGRWVPFVHSIFVEGADLTTASFAMQVRDRWNGGQIRADLDTVTTASAQGLRLVDVTWDDGIPTSEIGIRINETTMQAISAEGAGLDPDADVSCVYDIHVKRTAGMPEIWMRGPFNVQAGSTE